MIKWRKTISRLEVDQKRSKKVKLLQLFKRIAKHLDLFLTYPQTLRKLSISYYHCTFIIRNSWWKLEIVRVRKGIFLKLHHWRTRSIIYNSTGRCYVVYCCIFNMILKTKKLTKYVPGYWPASYSQIVL